MEGTAHLAAVPLGIQRVRDRERFGIRLEDRAQGGTLAVERGDAIQVALRDAARRQSPGFHAVLELGDRGFLERKRLPACARIW